MGLEAHALSHWKLHRSYAYQQLTIVWGERCRNQPLLDTFPPLLLFRVASLHWCVRVIGVVLGSTIGRGCCDLQCITAEAVCLTYKLAVEYSRM